MASQITSLTIVYSNIYSGADKKTSKLCVTELCAGNSPEIGEFPTQMASNAQNVSIWWRHHGPGIYWFHNISKQVADNNFWYIYFNVSWLSIILENNSLIWYHIQNG